MDAQSRHTTFKYRHVGILIGDSLRGAPNMISPFAPSLAEDRPQSLRAVLPATHYSAIQIISKKSLLLIKETIISV